MIEKAVLEEQIEELKRKEWDEARILKKVEDLMDHGIPKKVLNKEELLSKREEILDRVSKNAQDYEYITCNCAQGTALALMEEFGLGNMELFKGLSPFPGYGATGRICGAVSGGVFALGLFFSKDFNKPEIRVGPHVAPGWIAVREDLDKFKEAWGSTECKDLQELIYGRVIDPLSSPTALEEFIVKDKGCSVCSLPPAYGARIAAGIIIDSMK